MFFKCIKNKKGFSLIETILVVAITGLIVSAVANFQSDIFSFSRNFSSTLSSVDDARKVLKPFANEVRGAAPSALGAYPIEEATSTSFIFFSDIDSDGVEERVRYFLDGDELKKGTIVPSGNPLEYDSSDEDINTVVYNIINQDIFSYYDTYYDGTTEPLDFPASVLDIRLIKIEIVIDKDANEAPPAFTVTTQVSFRNLKDNL